MTMIETIEHILNTIGTLFEKKSVEDISKYTNEHYTGPGIIIEYDSFDYDGERSDTTIVFDKDGNYIGTKSWIYFNDADKNWLDKIGK